MRNYKEKYIIEILLKENDNYEEIKKTNDDLFLEISGIKEED